MKYVFPFIDRMPALFKQIYLKFYASVNATDCPDTQDR